MVDNTNAGEKRTQDGTEGKYGDDEGVGFDDVAENVNEDVYKTGYENVKKAVRGAVHKAALKIVHEAVNEIARSTVQKVVEKIALNAGHETVFNAVHEAVEKVALNSMHDPKQRPCTSTRARKKHDLSRAFVQGS